MFRSLELAAKGIGFTRPNPSVGAVVVHNNLVIGEGYTSPYGGPHAEVNAINSVVNKELLKESTLYVTLEPCSHFGKTPPCSDLIIQKKIPRVFVGCIDENPKVGGKGIQKLRDAGVEVEVGLLENECKEHHKRFFTFYNRKRPYIILKWAESTDGFLAPITKEVNSPVWISNAKSRQLVHQWRAEEHAILVGANTVLKDNPSLTVRDANGLSPIRIVLDSENSLSQDFQVFDGQSTTHVLNTIHPNEIVNHLFQLQIQSIIIEGGAKTLQRFIDSNLWDEARVFRGNVLFKDGVKVPVFSGRLTSENRIDNDILKIYRND